MKAIEHRIMEATAIVLAGGKGSRMGYRDKAWVIYQGTPLIQLVISAISGDVDDIIISSNSDHPAWAELPWRRVADDQGGFPGPLEGIASCVKHVETEFTLVVPCDIPNLPRALTPHLFEHLGDADIAVVDDGQRIQWLVFLARTKCLAGLGNPRVGDRSVHGWIGNQRYRVVKAPEGSEIFKNINELPE